MPSLIDTSVVAQTVSVTEDELKARLIADVLEGLRIDPATPGLTTTCLRGERPKFGYTVAITRDMKLAPKRIEAPK